MKIPFFVFGIMIGSFLNALIYRLPRKINISLPRSSCPNCKKMIFWYENIPIFSYLFLKGKCSGCKKRISMRYPLIECLTGLAAVFLAPSLVSLINVGYFSFYFVCFCIFLLIFFIDLDHKIIPDSLNIYLGVIFFTYSVFHYHYFHWLIGAAVGFLFPFSVTWLFYKLKGKIGLGGGDIKLFAVLGLILGPQLILQNIFLSCFLGACIGLLVIGLGIVKKEEPIPFGPFIIVIATFQIFFSREYYDLLGHLWS